jgi:AraC-type transcriptional regulator N-terminus.
MTPRHYLISSVDLPITSHLVEASLEKPYLSLRLNLDPSVITSVIIESGIEIKNVILKVGRWTSA